MNRILIVDDSPTNLALINRLVGRSGDCETSVHDDPVPALLYLRDHDVDLILVDYVMPGIDGVQFVRRVRRMERHAKVPIVVVTGASDREVRLAALEAGATDFLTKPIETVEFRVRVRNLLDLGSAQRTLARRAARLDEEVAAKTRELVEREQEIIWRLSRATEGRDTETGAHIARMARVCGILARHLRLPEEDCQLIEIAAQMHDVGKVGIPDEILFKPGPLDPDERRVMETHTLLGWSILEGSESRLLKMAAEIAVSHHEKWDGSGYPKRLAGPDIPIVGRITALADVFDALMSVRPYKRAWTLAEARDFVVGQAGRHFDPDCVTAFEHCFAEIAAIAGSGRSGDGDVIEAA